MVELTLEELEQKLARETQPFAVFFYTPLCGTCKLAERMLAVVLHLMPTLSLFRVNINHVSDLAQQWQIASVPALVLLRDGAVAEKHYALRSVDYLYQILKSLK
ncbi:thioredoxin family protein [Brevibacillus sp. H7]|uniref:thioredoxin family protein n=1 Tax=Brevibacillus sp. H7 TaxID=3349138 RepID=UPI003810AB83